MSTVYCIHVGVPCINTLRTAGLFYLLSSAFYPEFIDELKQNKPIIFLHLSTEFGYDFNFFYTMQECKCNKSHLLLKLSHEKTFVALFSV